MRRSVGSPKKRAIVISTRALLLIVCAALGVHSTCQGANSSGLPSLPWSCQTLDRQPIGFFEWMMLVSRPNPWAAADQRTAFFRQPVQGAGSARAASDEHASIAPVGIRQRDVRWSPGGKPAAQAQVSDAPGESRAVANVFGLAAPVTDVDSQTGVSGTDGANVISVNAPLTTDAVSSANGFDISLSLDGSAGADVSVTSTATATGVVALGGNDTITVSSTLDTTASASADVTSLTFNLFDNASANGAVLASATATGIDADVGDDTITVDAGGEATVAASSVTVGGTFDITLVDVLGGHVDTTLNAHATATGIAGGAGNDTITNYGTITVTAQPLVTGGTLNFGLVGNASYETSRLIESRATGIAGGDDNDVITNNGTITADALGSIVVADFTFDDAASDISSADAAVASNANAVGIDGGAGNDTIINNDLVDVSAGGTVVTGSGIVGLISIDPFESEAIVDHSPAAVAVATGLAGGEGDDTLENHGTLQIDAAPTLTSTEFDFAIIGTISATAANRADATAIGMDGGAGHDTMTNDGTINAEATAHTNVNAIDAALTLVPVPTGLVFTSANAMAISSANSIGIEGGDGRDTITNAGDITANATATMTSIEVIAKVGLSGGSSGGGGGGGGANLSALGNVAGEDPPDETSNVGVVDASTVRDSLAVAISGGNGADTITNTGTINTTTDASSVGVMVDASLAVEIGGLAATSQVEGSGVVAAVADPTGAIDAGTIARSIVRSTAFGIDGGNGADTITNSGTLNATALASATDVAVKANIAIPTNPLSLFDLGTGVDAQCFTDSLAVGLAGGGGADSMLNEDVITVLADSSSAATEVEVNTQITIPLPMFFDPFSDVTGLTSASAYGMHGDNPLDDSMVGDDVLHNTGTLDVTAEASADADSVAIVLGGDALATAITAADANAVAMAGGGGDDVIVSEGAISVTADASVDVGTISLNLIAGASITNTGGTTATASATGIDGGAGNDSMMWTQAITATATSDATADSSNLESIGASVHTGGLTSVASATGANGGSGNDIVDAMSTVTATATATGGTSVSSANLIGAAVAHIETEVTAAASGVTGGAGDDHITIHEMITATATADTTATGAGINLIGAGVQDASVTANAESFGVNGDGGDDTLINLSTIDVDANSTGHSHVEDVSLIGASVGDVSLIVTGNATGMSGGAGDDVVINQGTIEGDATGTATLTNFSFSLGGVATAELGDASTTASPSVTGMAGGAGNDALQNESTIDVATSASLTTETSAAIDIFGVANVDAIVAASPTATGMSGGDGDDFILNLDLIDVTSSATMNLLSGTSFSFGGVASDDAQVTASASAFGLVGGDGADEIRNEGSVTVVATSTMDVDSNSAVAFGAAHTHSQTHATGTAYGIDGGDLSDSLWNIGSLNVTATATTTSTHSAYSFGGSPTATAVIESISDATGVLAREGDDWIRNDGTIDVQANATLTSTGGASATFGSAAVSATAGSTLSAAGVVTGTGDDVVVNHGDILVDAECQTSVSNDSNAGFVFGDAGADTDASSEINAFGIVTGTGDDEVLNTGLIDVTVDDTTGPLTVNATSHSNGGDITLDGDARSTSSASLLANLTGIDGGNGDNIVINDGTIDVLNAPTVAALSDADGDGLDGDGFGTTSVNVGSFETPISAIGIAAGNGNNHIENAGTMTIEASPVGDSDVLIDGDNTGSAFGVTATTVRALAAGISTGGGANFIHNAGTINVTASANGDATSVVGAGWLGDAFEVGDAAAVAAAFGIRAGDGGNEIWNSGTINVTASAIATGTTFDSTDADATAIKTGSGDDVIVNAGNGMITTSTSENGASAAGIAIDAGAGNDLVRLLDHSTVVDNIVLGDGNDIISFAGSAVASGVILGGAGLDSLRIEDRRVLTIDPASIPGIEILKVNKGTLELTDGYAILDGGRLQVKLFKGGFGQLVVNGDAVIGNNSELTVIAGRRLYADGESFDVMLGNSIGNTFGVETMDKTAFLSFGVVYLPDTVRIEASVLPFESLATNTVHRAVGRYLDEIASEATGDLEDVLTEIQQLNDQDDINVAYCSLSPDSFDASTQAVVDVSRNQSRLLQRRMRSVQNSSARGSAEPANELAWADFSLAGLSDSEPGQVSHEPTDFAGFWVSGLGQWGNQNGSDGFSGFDYSASGVVLGFDHLFTEHLMAGVSFAYTSTDIDLDDGRGSGDISGLGGSIYGGWFTDNAWIDGTLSYAHQDFDNRRQVTVGTIDRTAASDHDGDVLAASIEGGPRFQLSDQWSLDPYAGFIYTYLDEGAFRESGAGSVDLVVDGRTTDSLISEVGVRLTGRLQHEKTTFAPFIGAAWVHDFQIDDRSITSGFAGAPGTSFALNGRDLESNRARIEAGVGLNHGSMSASVQYFGEFASGYENQGVLASIGISF